MKNSNICLKQGDLLKAADTGMLNAIVHGCNCFCTMGGGIAAQIRAKYPEAYEADKETVRGDKNKLGTYTFVKSHINTTTLKAVEFYVINAYTQYDFGSDGHKHCYFDYKAFEKIFTDFNNDPKVQGKIIGIPWIGCGLAGGSPKKVLSILEKVVKTYHVWIYDFNPSVS